MKVVKQVLLYAYTVEYVDQREPKPRTLRRETIVLDRERVHALDLLGVTVPDWIVQNMAKLLIRRSQVWINGQED